MVSSKGQDREPREQKQEGNEATLKLDGELKITLIGKAMPAAGSHQLFEAGQITGSFDKLSLPKVPGLTWVTDQLETEGIFALK